nr:reverse transcriptase domain-containing protein [Tanacetum cinerariifolium]
MRTRSQSRHNSPQQEASPVIVKHLRIELPFLKDQFQEDPPPEVPMADNRTMAELLQAPTEGYEDAIVIQEIAANNFELKHGLINLVQNKQFFGHDKENPHAHIRYFNKITSMMRVPNFFPFSKTTNLRNEITRFQQRFDESFYAAWDRFNDLLRACPHHGFSELHQLDTFYNALNVNDQDSLNSAVGTSSSTPAVSSEVAELKDLVRALLLDKKNQSSAPVSSSTPAPVKAVKPNCVTCGGTHSYQNCPATSRNVYRDNIQEYVSHAAATNYNQGNTGFRPQMVANQIRPLGFPPHQNNQNNFNQGNNFNQNQGGNFNQSNFNQSNFNQGGNFNQGQLHRPQVNQPLAYQAPAYQAPIPQTQSVSQTDFESYVKANDAVLWNMQNQGQNVQNQLANLTNMMFKFMSFNTASSSGSGTLPNNTITNPKEELKGITTRSGVAYQGPTIPTPSKVVKQGTEVTKDQVQTPSSQSTTPVQPPVSQSETPTPISELVVAPVSAPMPNVKSSIPYPSRRDNERRHDQANEQIEKFYEIFKDMSFEISFTDALILMPKFASTLKALIGNKEKLIKMARTPMNEHYLGASINLMPFSMWEALSLSELTPTCMTLELADHSVSKPIGIAKDVSFKVGVFHFPADFVVVDFEPDPRVPLILRRCFLKIGRALIDVHKGELTFRIENEAITYNLNQTVRYSANYNQMKTNKIDVIEMACEEYSQKVLGFSDVIASGNPTPHDDLIVSTMSHTLTPFGDSDFILSEEADAFLELKVCEAKTVKSSVDEPPKVELKDLPPHLEYAFLEGNNQLPVIIAKELEDEEKSAFIMVLKSHKRAIAWKLSNIQGINPEFCTHKILMEEDYKPAVQHQRRVNPKIHDVIKKEVEKLLDAGLIYPISDSPWVSPSYFMVKEGIVLGHKISKNGIEVDRAKVDVIAKLPHPTTVEDVRSFLDCIKAFKTLKKKLTEAPILIAPNWDLPFELMCDASDFAIVAVLGQRHEKHFKPIHYASKTMNDAESNYTMTEKEMLAVVYAFKKSRSYLIMNKSIVHTDHSALKYLFAKKDAKARLLCASWFADFANYHAGNFIVKGPFPSSRGNKYILVAVDYLSKWVEEKALPTNDARVVCKFFKSLFARFGAPRAIISDRGTHFCNDQFAKVMLKYGVTHCLSTAYHPQSSGQVEVSNCGLKRILERTIGENRASWSDKLDDALWAFRPAYKTPIRCTPYKLVYGKACHLPIELEHKAYWALKQANFDLAVARDHQKIQLNELNEIRDHAYENSLIYKEKTKRIHDSKIKNRVFNVGDRVLLYNSRLKIFSGKLKTRWSGPFTITKVFPYGTVELSQANGPNFKVNGHRVKHYFGGDVPQLVDYPDCEVSRALSFSFTRASLPQPQFGNPVSESYRLTFSFGIPNKRP